MTSPVIKITELVVFYLPLLKTLIVVVIMAAGTTYLFRARVPSRRWLTVCTRLAGAVLLLPLILGFFFLFWMAGYRPRPKIFVSPDSQHIAEYSYDPGFLGRDITVVTVRKKWSVQPEEVYEYDGPSDWTATEVRWLTNDRLLVRYYLDQEHRFQQCKREAAGILVQCAPVTR